MKQVLITLSVVLACQNAVFGQSKVVAVSSSALSAIELPAGSKQDKRLLVTATASAVLQMGADEQSIKLGDDLANVEVFTLPGAMGNEIKEQVKSAASRVGWLLTEVPSNNNYWLLTKNNATLFMYLASSKKDTQLYLSPVVSAPETVSTAAPIKAENQQTSKANVVVEQSIEKAPPAQQVTQVGTAKNTFAFTSTNFDDGWVSTISADYVKVTKGTSEVYLYYPEDFSSTYSGKIEPEDHYWNTLISKNFITHNAARWVQVTYPPIHFMEGDATEKQTGKKCFLAMNVVFNNGGATVMLMVTPSKSAYYELFQNPRDMERMLNYNKFAVSASDLVGKWTENSGSSVSLYNTYTGNYAGSNYTSSAHSFGFSNGAYTSKHSVISSVYGTNTAYTQEYTGKLLVNNWEMSLTNRWKEQTESFHAQFEVIRGGRVLHLQNKEASGITYHLVRVE